MDLFDLE